MTYICFYVSWDHGNFGKGTFLFTLNKIFIILRKLIRGIIMCLVGLYVINQSRLFIKSWNCFIFLVFLLYGFRKHVDNWWILYKSGSLNFTKLVLLMLTMTYLVVQKVFDYFLILTIKRILNVFNSIWNLLQDTVQLLFYVDNHFINLNNLVIY